MAWCLSVRPELRVTRGSDKALRRGRHRFVGNEKKSRLFNYDLLETFSSGGTIVSGVVSGSCSRSGRT